MLDIGARALDLPASPGVLEDWEARNEEWRELAKWIAAMAVSAGRGGCWGVIDCGWNRIEFERWIGWGRVLRVPQEVKKQEWEKRILVQVSWGFFLPRNGSVLT